MKCNYRSKTKVTFTVALVALTFAASHTSFAQDSLTEHATPIPSSGHVQCDGAKLIYPPNVPMTDSALYRTSSPAFRPTMSEDAYQAAKAAAAVPGQGLKQGGGAIHSNAAGTVTKFGGLNEAQSADLGIQWNPSDSNGAIGVTQYCEITNDALEVFSRTGTKLKTTPLSVFFGYNTESMFDPTVKYDRLWNRWIVSATSYPESSTVMYLHWAVSTTDNAKGPYWYYSMNVHQFEATDYYWDDGRIGMTQDSILFDANVYDGSTFEGASFFSIAKAILYNGGFFDVPIFQHLNGTLTLPVVSDQDANAYLIYNEPGTSDIGEYIAQNTSNAFQAAVYGPYQVNAGFTYNVPPSAVQPRSSYTLDTLDTRFPNNTVQEFGLVYATNTIYGGGSPSYPINEFWLIDGTSATLYVPAQPFYVTDTSNDFNPNIAVDTSGDIGVEWSETDPGTGQEASIYVNGALDGTVLPTGYGVLVSRSKIAEGTGANTLVPWGEYSSISADPTDDDTFWGTNMLIGTSTSWTTENFHFKAQ